MLSIKNFSDSELLKQIADAREELDSAEYGTADYNAALSELHVAEREADKRGLN